MLIHANARWPEAVNTYLWPYALRLACEAFNESPTKKMGWTPVEIFTQSSVMPEFKHWRPFGCPVYVLDQALQNAGGIKQSGPKGQESVRTSEGPHFTLDQWHWFSTSTLDESPLSSMSSSIWPFKLCGRHSMASHHRLTGKQFADSLI